MKTIATAALACAGFLAAGLAGANAQDQNAAQQNSVAAANAVAAALLERQVGEKVPAEQFGALEVDLNFDGFPELFVYRSVPDCDGVTCGNFVFVLSGDGYVEVLGGVAGARLVPPPKIGFAVHKRGGFIDLQFDQNVLTWDGQRYVDETTIAPAALDGDAFMEACVNPVVDDGNGDPPEARQGLCTCRLDRLKAIGFSQQNLGYYTRYVHGGWEEIGKGTDFLAWQKQVGPALDVEQGCRVAAGLVKWGLAYFNHGDQPPQQVRLDGFVRACGSDPLLQSQRAIRTEDRAFGACGCIGREIPTYGAGQPAIDALAGYFRAELSEADVEDQAPGALDAYDQAAEECVRVMPDK